MFNLLDLLRDLHEEYQIINSDDCIGFDNVAPVNDADETSLIFINRPDHHTPEIIRNTRAQVVLLNAEWGVTNAEAIRHSNKCVVLVQHPRLVIRRLLKTMYPAEDEYDVGIHPSAIIHPLAEIHPSVSIGQSCIIGKCTIDEDSRIDASSIIKDNVVIGKRVVIRENCIIGGCGFGFVADEQYRYERIPHVGTTFIEDDVEIYPFSNVDRGTLSETVVRRGAKIDHYCHIGHNAIVGEDTILAAKVVLCGSSKIGKRCWAGVASIIKENVKVGDDVVIGIGAVVIRDVDDDMVVAGVPAKPIAGKAD